MSKKEALKKLNVLIDNLIIKGLTTPARIKEFHRLCALHTQLLAEIDSRK